MIEFSTLEKGNNCEKKTLFRNFFLYKMYILTEKIMALFEKSVKHLLIDGLNF